MLFIYIGIFIIVSIICGLLGTDFINSTVIATMIVFLVILMISAYKGLDRKRYRCIEGNLYMVSENLINKNKKCKIYKESIYQIEENGDLTEVDFQR